jgi:hypothetical protein
MLEKELSTLLSTSRALLEYTNPSAVSLSIFIQMERVLMLYILY